MMAAHDNGFAKQAGPYNPSVVARERAVEGLRPNGHRSDFHVPKSGRNPAAESYIPDPLEPEHDGSGDIGHNGFDFAIAEDIRALPKLKAIDAVLNSLVYNQTDALVMIGLIVRSDRHYQNAWPSTKTLAKYAKVSKDETIYQSVKKLESPPFGVITKRDRGRGKSNVYSVLTDRVCELVALEYHEQQALKAYSKKPSTKADRGERGPGQEDLFAANAPPLKVTPARRGATERGPDQGGSFATSPLPVNGTAFAKAPPLNGTTTERDTPAEGESIPSKSLNTERGCQETTTASRAHGAQELVVVSAPSIAPGRKRGTYSKAEYDYLYNKLVDAAEPMLSPLALKVGLMTMTEVENWIENGADLELDILPSLRETARRETFRHGKITTWRYFTNSITGFAAKRRYDDARDGVVREAMAQATVPVDQPEAWHSHALVSADPVRERPAPSGELVLTSDGKMRPVGAFRADLEAQYAGIDIDACCAAVAADLLKYRRRGAVSENEIKALIRGECARAHAPVASARKWGKGEAQDVTNAFPHRKHTQEGRR